MDKRPLFLLLALAACTQSPAPSRDAAVEALLQADRALEEAIAARDLERIAAFYAEEAVLLPTAEPMVEGISAIREEWAHILAIPDFESRSSLRKVEVSSSADMGYTMGTYVATMLGEDGASVTEPGKWVSVWKKGPDGAWRIIVETYNTDVPPPDHK